MNPAHAEHPFEAGGVALVPGRLRKWSTAAAQQARDEVNNLVRGTKLFERAPFTQLMLIIRKGTVLRLDPEYERLRSDGELGASIEVPMQILKDLDANFESLVTEYKWLMLSALIGVCAKYELPNDVVVEALLETETRRSQLRGT